MQKLATALELGVPEFSDKQKKITSILLKWEEVRKENANKAALVKKLDEHRIPYSLIYFAVRNLYFCAPCDCCDMPYYSRPKSNKKRQVQRKYLH